MAFAQKTVVVTGGSSGLGLALAEALAPRGARLVLVARNPERLEAAAAKIRAGTPGAVVETRSLDVSDPDAVRVTFDRLAGSLGPMDVLINNAGVLHSDYFERLSAEVFRETMDIDFFGPLHTTQAALPQLKATRGRLVNVASTAGFVGVFGYTAYCAAKHAVVGWTESLRYELEPQGIRVHLVCPSEFESPMVDALEADRLPENRVHTLMIPRIGVNKVVEDTLRRIEKDRYLIIPNAQTRVAMFGARHLPSVGYHFARRLIRKVYRGPGAVTE